MYFPRVSCHWVKHFPSGESRKKPLLHPSPLHFLVFSACSQTRFEIALAAQAVHPVDASRHPT